MTHFVGLDVSQKMTSICVVDNAGRRLWRGQCPSVRRSTLAASESGDFVEIGGVGELVSFCERFDDLLRPP
jgi:hypothetical protein